MSVWAQQSAGSGGEGSVHVYSSVLSTGATVWRGEGGRGRKDGRKGGGGGGASPYDTLLHLLGLVKGYSQYARKCYSIERVKASST